LSYSYTSWYSCETRKIAASGNGRATLDGCNGIGVDSDTLATLDDSVVGTYLLYATFAQPAGWSAEEIGSFSYSTTTAKVEGIGVNTTPPAIRGNPWVGSVLAASPGSWTAYPAPNFTYQWYRAGAPIDDARGENYTLTEADIGYNITTEVTATNPRGTRSAATQSAFLVDGPPVISEFGVQQPIVGEANRPFVLKNHLGSAPTGFSYAWSLCTSEELIPQGGEWQASNPAPAGCTTIEGENSDSYTPVSTDSGLFLLFGLTASNANGTDFEWGRSESAIAPSSDASFYDLAFTRPPQMVSDGVTVGDFVFGGEKLRITDGEWSQPISYSERWWSSPGLQNWNDWFVPDNSSQLLTADIDVSSADGRAGRAKFVKTVVPAPTISGQNSVGGFLSVLDFFQTGSDPFLLLDVSAVEWQSCDSPVEFIRRVQQPQCVVVEPAQTSTFYSGRNHTVLDTELGRYTTAHIIATLQKADGTFEQINLWLPSMKKITKAPSNVMPPSMTGTVALGGTLRVFPGLWNGNPSLAYRWYTCNDVVGDSCTQIVGLNTDSFKPSADYLGMSFKVEVIASNAYGYTIETVGFGDRPSFTQAGPCSVADLHFRKIGQVGTKYSFAWDPIPSGCNAGIGIGSTRSGDGFSLGAGATTATVDLQTGYFGGTSPIVLVSLGMSLPDEEISSQNHGYHSYPILINR
jgi:hypothetical protein